MKSYQEWLKENILESNPQRIMSRQMYKPQQLSKHPLASKPEDDVLPVAAYQEPGGEKLPAQYPNNPEVMADRILLKLMQGMKIFDRPDFQKFSIKNPNVDRIIKDIQSNIVHLKTAIIIGLDSKSNVVARNRW